MLNYHVKRMDLTKKKIELIQIKFTQYIKLVLKIRRSRNDITYICPNHFAWIPVNEMH
jgi:hypothetical protein